jgi:hypothetical protein
LERSATFSSTILLVGTKAPARPSQQQGCQILLGATYQNGENFTKWPQNMPNDHETYQMAMKHTNGSKIYQHCIFQGPPNIPKEGFLA